MHAPEVQYWISKLAMLVAEVGTVHASSTLVWGLMPGSGSVVDGAEHVRPVAAPRHPDAGGVGDDHPSPQVNMSSRDTCSRLQFRGCVEEDPGDCCVVHATDKVHAIDNMSMRHKMQLSTSRNAIALLFVPGTGSPSWALFQSRFHLVAGHSGCFPYKRGVPEAASSPQSGRAPASVFSPRVRRARRPPCRRGWRGTRPG